jgi:Domain of unknown function (DUF5063)
VDYAAAINAFIGVARDYCAWCEGARASEPRLLHLEATRHVARLYAAALELPDVELEDYPAPPNVPQEVRHAMFKSFSALPFNYYRDVFDPSIEGTEEPVTGDLADDLTDIYYDLHDGFALLRSGNEPAAVWNWRFSFGIHWGRHATSALRALNCYEFPDE